MLGSLMRQPVPPAGIFSVLENASLIYQGTGRPIGWGAKRTESLQAGKGLDNVAAQMKTAFKLRYGAA